MNNLLGSRKLSLRFNEFLRNVGRDLFARLFHIRQSHYNSSELEGEGNYGELKVSFAYRFPVSGHEIIKDRS